MKKRTVIATVVLLFVLQFPLFHTFWLTRMGSFLIHQDPITPADAILVLGGGKRERVLQGIALYREKFGNKVLFTGEYEQQLFAPPLHWAIEAQKLAVSRGLPEKDTIRILESKSTHDDALLSRAVCQTHHFRSLIVVSEPYHTERAFAVFKKVYRDSGIRVMLYPVQESWYKKDNWWKCKEGLLATNSEYVKFIYYFFKGYLI
jgi:uncharacterized SAM-binding protein YcdF (DUF218 family)